MRASRFALPLDATAVLASLADVCRLLAVILVPPTLVAAVAREAPVAAILGASAAALHLAGRLGVRYATHVLERREALVVAALAYPLFAVVGALAFLPQATYLDGLFEAMSGFTTTGLSVMDVEALPVSLLFFRAYSQWVGGAGVVVLGVVVLPGLGRSALQLVGGELSRQTLRGSVISTARVVLAIYLVLTAAAWVTFALLGADALRSMELAMSTISTGGFSTRPGSLSSEAGTALPWAVAVFMMLGATSFPLLYRTAREGPRRLLGDVQLRALLALILVAALFLLLRGRTGALGASIFHAVSAVTTTGFTLGEVGAWSPGERTLAVVLMVVGGSIGSTAGGIKLARALGIVAVVRWALVRDQLPRQARLPVRSADAVLSDEDFKRLLAFLACYVGMIAVSTLALSAGGFPLADALFESASALGTVGLSSGVTSAAMPAWAKLVLVVDMWAGRIEILPVLFLFHPATWMRLRAS